MYALSLGLLGTNNNEVYDEFRLPDNTITSSVSEFVNSWLVTRSGRCVIKEENNEAPTCSISPSERCFELLKSPKSPFAAFFKSVDPLPFLKACLVDTADCEPKQDRIIAHCNATSAYRRVLKVNGYGSQNVEDCCKFLISKRPHPSTNFALSFVKDYSKEDFIIYLSCLSHFTYAWVCF